MHSGAKVTKNIWYYGNIAIYQVRFHAKISGEVSSENGGHSNSIENIELHQSVGDSSLCPNQPKNEFSPAENWKFKQGVYVEQKNHILRHFSPWKFSRLTENP